MRSHEEGKKHNEHVKSTMTTPSLQQFMTDLKQVASGNSPGEPLLLTVTNSIAASSMLDCVSSATVVSAMTVSLDVHGFL